MAPSHTKDEQGTKMHGRLTCAFVYPVRSDPAHACSGSGDHLLLLHGHVAAPCDHVSPVRQIVERTDQGQVQWMVPALAYQGPGV